LGSNCRIGHNTADLDMTQTLTLTTTDCGPMEYFRTMRSCTVFQAVFNVTLIINNHKPDDLSLLRQTWV